MNKPVWNRNLHRFESSLNDYDSCLKDRYYDINENEDFVNTNEDKMNKSNRSHVGFGDLRDILADMRSLHIFEVSSAVIDIEDLLDEFDLDEE